MTTISPNPRSPISENALAFTRAGIDNSPAVDGTSTHIHATPVQAIPASSGNQARVLMNPRSFEALQLTHRQAKSTISKIPRYPSSLPLRKPLILTHEKGTETSKARDVNGDTKTDRVPLIPQYMDMRKTRNEESKRETRSRERSDERREAQERTLNRLRGIEERSIVADMRCSVKN